MKGWRLGLWLTAFWTLAAGAEPVCVEALCLEPTAPWQRGPAEQERSDEVYLLDLPGAQGFDAQLLLPRQAPRIKGEAAGYYDRLIRYWRANYGPHVLIDWVELGGVRWRSLRRPASENGRGVFHLSTVAEGRAHSVLVFVPGTVTTLPDAVRALLGGAVFASAAGAPAQTVPTAPSAARPGPAPATAASGAEAAPVPPRWQKTRVYRLVVLGDALEAVAALDAEALGPDAALTGFGLDYGEASVGWSLEGYAWSDPGRHARKLPWTSQGRLAVAAPAELEEGATWTLALSGVTEGVAASLAVRDLCGPEPALAEALRGLARGLRAPLDRLAQQAPAGCPPPRRPPAMPSVLGRTGGDSRGVIAWPEEAPPAPLEQGLARVRLVEAVLGPEPGRRVPGEALLSRARLFFAYEWR
jgi:hypothetical protein